MSFAPMSWQAAGVCRPADLDVFFGPDIEEPADRQAREAQAIAICARCPVTTACMEWHLGFSTQHGVAGGVGEDDRKALRHAWLKRRQRAA